MSEPHFFPLLRTQIENEPWCLDSVSIEGSRLLASGWALPVAGDPARGQILVNGGPAEAGSYGAHREDVGRLYRYLDNAALCGFSISAEIDREGRDHVELSYASAPDGRILNPYQTYYIPLFSESAPYPDLARRARTTGPTAESTFAFGGYTLARKIDLILGNLAGRNLSSFRSILDWGGGCGRVTRYLQILAPEARVTLADIDADNVGWSAANLPGINAVLLPLHPPSPFENNTFDLVVGNSVFTHLREEVQFAWLEELRRVTAPGAMVVVTVHGPKDLMRASENPAHFDALSARGFLDQFPDDALLGHISDNSCYCASFHTHAYIRERWSRYFEIIDIIRDASNNHQDIVVMRRT